MLRPQTTRVRQDPWGPEPGTTEPPAGHVRMYHYMPSDKFESVVSGGIQLREAQGQTYGEPNAVWGSTQQPDPEQSYVEAHIPYRDYEPGSIGLPDAWHEQRSSDEGIREYNAGNHNFALGRSVPPEAIVAKNTYAMNTTRAIESNGGVPDGRSAQDYYGASLPGTKEFDQRHPKPGRTMVGMSPRR